MRRLLTLARPAMAPHLFRLQTEPAYRSITVGMPISDVEMRLDAWRPSRDLPRLSRTGVRLVLTWRGIHRGIRWYGSANGVMHQDRDQTTIDLVIEPSKLQAHMASTLLMLVASVGILSFIGSILSVVVFGLSAPALITGIVALALMLLPVGIAAVFGAIHRWTVHQAADRIVTMIDEQLRKSA